MRSDHRDLVRTRLDAITRGGAGPARDDPDPASGDGTGTGRDRRADYFGAGDGGAGDFGAGDGGADDGAGFGDFGTDDAVPAAAWTISERLRAARWELGRGGVAAVAAVACAAVLVTVVVIWRDRPVPDPVPPLPAVETIPVPAAPAPVEAEPPPESVVSVVGLVAAPGLVRLAPGARVADALDAAGGVLEGADLLGLNLAQRVVDGDQIVVGVLPPAPPPAVSGVATGGQPPAGGPAAAATPDRVNLNTCDEAALDALPGVGPVTAAAIIAFRTRNGPFADVEQLAEVDGIGPARLARLRELVTV